MFNKSSIVLGLVLIFGLINTNLCQNEVEQIRFGLRQTGDFPIHIETQSSVPTDDPTRHVVEFHWFSEVYWHTQIVVEVTNWISVTYTPNEFRRNFTITVEDVDATNLTASIIVFGLWDEPEMKTENVLLDEIKYNPNKN